MKVLLTKRIKQAIEEFGSSFKDRVYWEWFTKGSRTGHSGYALYVQTGFHENGRRINRRLWVNPDERYALQIAEAIEKQTGDSGQIKALKMVIEVNENYHAEREAERRLDFRQYRERWPR